MRPSATRPLPIAVAGALDLLALLVFAAAGKSSHDEHGGLVEVLVIAWPFAVGAAVGWAAHQAVRRTPPISPTAGLWVVAAAVLIGHLLRLVTGRGSAAPFVVVSLVVLTLLLVGWRSVAAYSRRHDRGRDSEHP